MFGAIDIGAIRGGSRGNTMNILNQETKERRSTAHSTGACFQSTCFFIAQFTGYCHLRTSDGSQAHSCYLPTRNIDIQHSAHSSSTTLTSVKVASVSACIDSCSPALIPNHDSQETITRDYSLSKHTPSSSPRSL
ncbi:hypothetical protein M378DRAFT_167368 [Amanita muscaria Koide BX008]|uniref:Uncharacterized protein n=1 Tax=Amanita muscaria (strain Koide BX008) TaxID=946122 RepID=A0A0C2WHU5_AMAMK|nr:hypothetical protein M378DRAFT_167368 [Amanita muscaria Koide BX008]